MSGLLIIGAGQLGMALQRVAMSDPAWRAVPLAVLDHAALDLCDREAVAARLVALRPDVVINAAAYNRVDEAEKQPAPAFATNASAPGALALAASQVGARLVHVSTDYVFSGEADRPYREDDLPAPCSVYGASKLAGEHLVRAYAPGALIVRTSGVYGVRRPGVGKRSFVEAILQQARAGNTLQVVADQRASPTYAVDLAWAILALLGREAAGIVHVTNAGSCSWYEFAQAILEEAGIEATVTPVASRAPGDMGWRAAGARRPSYSVLDHGRLRDLGITMPHWRDALARYIREQAGGAWTAAVASRSIGESGGMA